MAKITYNNKEFWEWMRYLPGSRNCYAQYIEDIAGMMTSHTSGHVAYASRLSIAPSSFIRELWDSVPIWYYEEMLYCAQAYSILFGSLFPRLVENVEELAYLEWLLYTEPGYRKYRDHLVHMFKVAHVCDKWVKQRRLLNNLTRLQLKSRHFQEWLSMDSATNNAVDNENIHDIVRIALFIAAVFHDFGYGYFFLNSYKKRLHRLNKWLLPGADPMDRNLDATQKILKSLPAEFVRTYHQSSGLGGAENNDQRVAGFFYDNRLLNHSVASTFFIVDLCEKLYELEAISGPLYVAFQLAAEICMIHDMTGNGNDMTKDSNWMYFDPIYKDGPDYFHFIDSKTQKQIPLSMLFILSDELAIWNRATMELKHHGDDAVQQTIKTIETNKSPDKIEINLTYSPKRIAIDASKRKTKSNLKKAINELKFLKDPSDRLNKILDFEIITQ